MGRGVIHPGEICAGTPTPAGFLTGGKHPVHGDIATQWNGFDPKLCLAPGGRPQGGAKAHHELGNPHTKALCRGKVPPFVQANRDPEPHNQGENPHDEPTCLFHADTILASTDKTQAR